MGDVASGGGGSTEEEYAHYLLVIARVARELGIPVSVAMAIAYHESGLNPHAVGDNGTSFGLFQLHEGGELGSHSAEWAFNAENNAMTSLRVVAQQRAAHPNLSWGEVAALAQRPADPAGYAAAVNGLLAGFHASGEKPLAYWSGKAGPITSASYSGGGDHPEFSGNGKGSRQDYFDAAGEYGYLAAYLNDPEIGPILRRAARNGWGTTKLLSALEKTHWWKTTSQTAREMQALQRTDPATYRQQFRQMRVQVGSLARSMGIKVNDKRLDHIATTALWSGWSNLQIQQAVGHEFHYNPEKAYKGTAGATIQQFKSMAGQYLVPLGDHAIGHWTRQALEGKINPDDYSGYLAEQAKSLFPWMAKAIDKGTTPTQFLAPYVQAASATLELDPASIDLTKHRWRHLFETVDPKTGERTERGLANAMTLMRTDSRYGYDFTQGAREEAAGLAAQIAQAFGFQA